MTPTLPVTGNTEQTKPENRAFYPALDGLRAIAFLLVFFYHYEDLPWGWAGVDVFFVISGFLITGILFDTRDDAHRARNFYVRRSLRIFPLYYGVLLAIVLLEPFLHWKGSWYWLAWPFYVGNLVPYFMAHLGAAGQFNMVETFIVDRHHLSLWTPLVMGHFWTLCVEEQFYLIWPWVVFFVRDRRKLLWICAIAFPACLFLRMLGVWYLPVWMKANDVLFHATPFRIDDLLLGGLLALLLRGPYARDLLRWARVAFPAAWIALIGTSLFFPFHRIWAWPYVYPGQFASMTWGLSIIGILSALSLLVIIQPGSLPARVLSLRPLRWLGRISYGAYVLHVIPKHAYASLGTYLYPSHERVMATLIALVSTILLAWLSFRFYESWFLNLKERWTVRS